MNVITSGGERLRKEEGMDVFCGIDWAEDHHDITLADRDGKLLARCRISDDAGGLAELLGLLAEHGDTPDDRVPVAIETPRGLLVACLRAAGRPVYPVNPMAVARYRDRHSVSQPGRPNPAVAGDVSGAGRRPHVAARAARHPWMRLNDRPGPASCRAGRR
jgi:hypothetical protein